MSKNPKLNLNDKVEDGEMDLSMMELTEAPVKEIATFKKVYSLDLSNNHLTAIQNSFCVLTNLTKLDLSKNQICELPENFGDLIRLQHLDLYRNQLTHLPLSFGNFKKLRWLDLKDNPLVPAIKDAAGDCLDSRQCQSCAVDIVNFFQKLKEKVDEERELRKKESEVKKVEEVEPEVEKKKKSGKKNKVKKTEPEDEVEVKSDDIIEANVVTKSVSKSTSSKCVNVLVSLLLVIAAFTIVTGVVVFNDSKLADFIEDYVSDWYQQLVPQDYREVISGYVTRCNEWVKSFGL